MGKGSVTCLPIATAWRAWSYFNRWSASVIWKMKNGFGVDRSVYLESIFYGGLFNGY